MNDSDLHRWRHSHMFGQDAKKPGENRTFLVIIITGITMVIEVAAGMAFGSMALLADGLHMASHAAALAINAFAYVYARRHSRDSSFSFGTGKVNALGGFSGAVLLSVFAVIMAAESVDRLIRPVQIVFSQAILVAVLGLVVNLICMVILGHSERHDKPAGHHAHDHDHNLRSAYLHVLADALTSLLAIFALMTAKYFGAVWMDPLMGVVGAILVSRWSWGLMRTSGAVLLDRQGPLRVEQEITRSVEKQGDTRVTDLHLWSVGPGIYAAIVVVVSPNPLPSERYKEMIPRDLGIAHITVETHSSGEADPASPIESAQPSCDSETGNRS